MRLMQLGAGFDGNAVSTFLNRTIFSITGSELPAEYIDILVLRSAGIVADRGLLALLAGTIVMCAFRITRSWIPLAYVGLFSFLVFIFGDIPFGGLYFNGDVLFALFSGGTIAAAFILMPDPATGAKSQIGILISTLCAALLTWVFRYCAFEIYGAFFAVALVNSFIPLLRFFESRIFYTRKNKIQGGMS
jgi:electron transport complex protein RnfD